MHCSDGKQPALSESFCLHRGKADTLPELVPVLKWVELRTNAFGSEQKSLRAWQRSESDGESEEG